MDRLTRLETDNTYTVSREAVTQAQNSYGGEAIERLGKFEDAYEYLLARQAQTVEKLEQLRAQGKKDSAKFRQILHTKMMNAQILSLFETHGLK